MIQAVAFGFVLSTVSAIDVTKKVKKIPLGQASLVSIPYRSYRGDCWKRRPVAASFLQDVSLNPGAGMDPDSIEPYKTVQKDGFMGIDCVKDAMLEHGDAHGDGKLRYKMAEIANVSIIHYTDIVPKEDRKQMTQGRCFEFCRTVPDMLFFGINNGRDCYCAPYYKPMASDSSECDAYCPGDDVTMCGGKSKSSIFSMHSCDDTRKNLKQAQEDANEALGVLAELITSVKDAAEQGEADANTIQESLGKAGDPDGSGLMQEAKVYAGELIHAAEDAQELVDAVQEHVDEVKSMKGKDMNKFKNAKKAEELTLAMQQGISEIILETEKMQDLLDAASPVTEDDEEGRIEDASKQYLPIMWFVDQEFSKEEIPSTCGGNIIQTVFGKSMDECSAACDRLVGQCVGFNYFGEGDGVCVLFDKFKTVQYWAGCAPEEDESGGKGKFMQVQHKSRDAPFVASCVARGADFEGTTLKPDRSGKCKQCLKEATKADRCYE